MSEGSGQREISKEEAIEALVDDSYGLERVSGDHELPRIHLEAHKIDEGLIWDSRETFSKHERDEAVSLLYELVDSWADERGYDVVVEGKDYYQTPIDEDLFQAVQGFVDMDDYEVDFLWSSRHNSIEVEFADYNRLDASMSDEYRELYSIAESVLEDVGRIEKRYPGI
jgi:hypothetical protein